MHYGAYSKVGTCWPCDLVLKIPPFVALLQKHDGKTVPTQANCPTLNLRLHIPGLEVVQVHQGPDLFPLYVPPRGLRANDALGVSCVRIANIRSAQSPRTMQSEAPKFAFQAHSPEFAFQAHQNHDGLLPLWNSGILLHVHHALARQGAATAAPQAQA